MRTNNNKVISISEHSRFMHSAIFHLYVEQKLKTGPALAGLTGPTPTALVCHVQPASYWPHDSLL